MCFCRSNALIPCSFCDSKINIIVLINGCLHNEPVICPRLVIMAHEYSEPTTMCTCKTDNFPINIRNQQLFDWIVKRYGKYGRKESWKVKRYVKFSRFFDFLSYCLRVFHVCSDILTLSFQFYSRFSCPFNFLMTICSLC
jgi:hypothetical protein